jgi:putative hydrolase of the HAD superfamily
MSHPLRTVEGMAPVQESTILWDKTIAGARAVVVNAPGARNEISLPVVIFDGDDTLWATEQLYDAARQQAAEVVGKAGLSSQRWSALQLEIDVTNVSRLGLLAERFPTSCVEAYEQLAIESGVVPSEDTASDVWAAASGVFRTVAPVHPAAHRVLDGLRECFRLVLLTQGDPRVQRKRISDSGLTDLFDEIVVVEKKSPEVLAAIVDHFDIDHTDAWMVGNSVPSDINPAVAVGMRAVWIDAHVWQHERREELVARTSGVFVAGDLSELETVLR